jgi:DNA-binding response OmpR family regulator
LPGSTGTGAAESRCHGETKKAAQRLFGNQALTVKPVTPLSPPPRHLHQVRTDASPSQEEMLYRVGDLELDRLSRQVTRGGNEILLLPTEFLLLEFLMKHAGQVVTRTMLLEDVWGYHFDPQTNVIDVHISRLRSKIDKGFAQDLLHTVRGAGFVIRQNK